MNPEEEEQEDEKNKEGALVEAGKEKALRI